MTSAMDYVEQKERAIRERAASEAVEIGSRCRRARGEVSQSWVVVMLEQEENVRLSTRALSEIESGKRALKLDEAAALARFYGVELSSLAPGGAEDHDKLARAGARELGWMRNLIDERMARLLDELGEE